MRIRVMALVEKVQESLFLVPTLAVIAAFVFGTAGVEIDRRFDAENRLPSALTSTVDSSREVLTTVAGASISFAGIAISVSLLILQLGSSQYSPRVVHTLFRDRFNRRVMGLVMGTFTFCLVVLRSARSALDEGGDPVVPNLSVIVAVFLGILTILAIVALIDHSAHSMNISEILERVRRDAVERIERDWLLEEPERTPDAPAEPVEGTTRHQVRFDRSGWVRHIDTDALLEELPPDTVLWLDATPGRYAIAGTLIGTVSPAPAETEKLDRRMRSAVGIGDSRTMRQDVGYGLRQLVDVALKALSSGGQDPTTAQDAIFHAAAVLQELLRRYPPPSVICADDNRTVVLTEAYTHAELIGLAFDEVRVAAADQPRVCIYLLESIRLLVSALPTDCVDRREALIEQARLVAAGCEASDLLEHDRRLVREAFEKRFGETPRSTV